MENDTLVKILTGGSPFVVLVVIVIVFLRDRKDMVLEHRAWMEQTIKNNQLWIERMHGEHLVARQETRQCLDRNTTSMEKNTNAIQELAKTMIRCQIRPSP